MQSLSKYQLIYIKPAYCEYKFWSVLSPHYRRTLVWNTHTVPKKWLPTSQRNHIIWLPWLAKNLIAQLPVLRIISPRICHKSWELQNSECRLPVVLCSICLFLITVVSQHVLFVCAHTAATELLNCAADAMIDHEFQSSPIRASTMASIKLTPWLAMNLIAIRSFCIVVTQEIRQRRRALENQS